MKIALAVVLGLVFLAVVLLDKTLRGIPAKELRRRARGLSDKRAAKVYKLAAHEASAELFLWLVGALSAAGLFLMAAGSSWWLGLLVVLSAMWLVWIVRPLTNTGGWLFRYAAWMAPPASAAVSFLQPALTRFLRRRRYLGATTPVGIYEKEDLLELLKIQGRRADNRISDEDLKTAAGALGLGDKTVGSVMTPRRNVKWVTAADPIGPMVMDELHKTGSLRFPVVKEITKSANPEVIGSLYLKDLLDNLEVKGRIRDIMQPGVGYINEAQSLRSALDGFLKSGRHLLVVVNNFEEIVGVLTLEDVLKQIFGQKISDDFDRYDDIRSVASYDGEQTRSQPTDTKVE